MTNNETLNFIKEVLSAIDSFQQDYGTFRYSITIQSYALHHETTIRIIDSTTNYAIQFIIEEEMFNLAVNPINYIYDTIREKSEILSNQVTQETT